MPKNDAYNQYKKLTKQRDELIKQITKEGEIKKELTADLKDLKAENKRREKWKKETDPATVESEILNLKWKLKQAIQENNDLKYEIHEWENPPEMPEEYYQEQEQEQEQKQEQGQDYPLGQKYQKGGTYG